MILSANKSTLDSMPSSIICARSTSRSRPVTSYRSLRTSRRSRFRQSVPPINLGVGSDATTHEPKVEARSPQSTTSVSADRKLFQAVAEEATRRETYVHLRGD